MVVSVDGCRALLVLEGDASTCRVYDWEHVNVCLVVYIGGYAGTGSAIR